MDPVARGAKCGPHGGKSSGTKSWTVSWLGLKTKVKPELLGSQVMSGDWQRLHRVCGVCSGSPENHWVTRLSHKTDAEDSTRRCGRPGRSNRQEGWSHRLAGLTAQEGRSDHPGRRRREASKQGTRVRIARLCRC
jgi:hypothetical protein